MLVGVRGQTLVFYDGVCGLCNRLVQFLLRRDRRGALRFAELQGEIARRELLPRGHDPADLDSVVVIADWRTPRQRVLTRSEATLHAIERLGGIWSAAAGLGRLVPLPLADALYRFVARRRYRLFGKYQSCPLPRPEWKERFVHSTDGPMDRSADG